jgi:glycosyltransferase involved in cell wall biosynthesis
MNIVIANKYYFYTGGPERYMMSVTELLQEQGHTVIPFALRLAQNWSTPYADYFVPPPAESDQYKLAQFKLSWRQKGQLVARATYSWEARRQLERLIHDAQVDLVYLLNICNYLSPSVIDAAHNLGVPVVMRLSDYNFACASYRFLRHGRVCTDCLTQNSFLPALRHRCTEGSLLQTLGRVLPMTVHRLTNILGKVDAFVAPSPSMAEALIRFGCDSAKVHFVPSFVNTAQFQPTETPSRTYALYAGRLDPDKGVHVLLDAWAKLGDGANVIPLYIAGTGTAVDELQAQAAQHPHLATHVHFLGQLSGEALLTTLQNAAFVIAPSLWMDNSPMAVYESLACGKPVIASDIGGLRGQVTHGENGFLFPTGNASALAGYAQQLMQDEQLLAQMSEAARNTAVAHFSPPAHWQKLSQLFNTLTPPNLPDNVNP